MDYDILNNPFIMTQTFYNMKQVLSAVVQISFVHTQHLQLL